MKSLSSDSFEEFIRAGERLVQFSATWCGPCKALTQTLQSSELAIPIGKVDIDDAPALSTEFGIRSVPTLILFRDGKEVNRTMGAKPLSKIKAFLEP